MISPAEVSTWFDTINRISVKLPRTLALVGPLSKQNTSLSESMSIGCASQPSVVFTSACTTRPSAGLSALVSTVTLRVALPSCETLRCW